MVRTIKAKLAVLCALGATATLVLGVVAFRGLDEAKSAMAGQAVTSTALRNQTEMDMMHDALRADLYKALVASSSAL